MRRILGFGALFLLLPVSAYAQANSGAVDQVVQRFLGSAAAIQNVMTNAGMVLFASLVAIELVYSLWYYIADRAEFGSLLAFIGRQIVTLGFFWWLLTNGGAFGDAIIRSFVMIGGQASLAAGGITIMSPSDIFTAGQRISKAMWVVMAWDHPLLGILLACAGLITIYAFAEIISHIVEVVIESALMVYAGIFLLGFGGTAFTREYAVAFFRICIAVGVKRMMMQILVGVFTGWIVQASAGIQAGTDLGWDTVAFLIMMPLVMLHLVEKIPYRAHDMIAGTMSHGSGGLFGRATGAATAVAAGALAFGGGAAAAAQAIRVASAQAGGQGGGSGQGGASGGSGGASGGSGGGGGFAGRISQAAMITGNAAKHFGEAASADIGRRLTGQYSGRHGSAGFRMAADIKAKGEKEDQS